MYIFWCSGQSITLCVAYLPPLSTPSYHLDLLLTPNEKTVILGDFNFPDISWETLSGTSSQSNYFCDLIYKFNLNQSVSHPTHVKGNILDIVLTVDSSNSLPLSDHFKITFSLTISTPPMAKSKASYISYSKADWPGLSSFLFNYNFTPIYSICDLDFIWSHPITSHTWGCKSIYFQNQNQVYSTTKMVHTRSSTSPQHHSLATEKVQYAPHLC